MKMFKKYIDEKKAYTIPNKVREIKGEQQDQQTELSGSSKQEQKSKRVESLAEIAKDLKFPSKRESETTTTTTTKERSFTGRYR